MMIPSPISPFPLSLSLSSILLLLPLPFFYFPLFLSLFLFTSFFLLSQSFLPLLYLFFFNPLFLSLPLHFHFSSLLFSLSLSPTSSKRLGLKGADQVKAHPFFVTDQWNWDNIRSTVAYVIPELKSEIDTTYFDDIEDSSTQTQSFSQPMVSNRFSLYYTLYVRVHEKTSALLQVIVVFDFTRSPRLPFLSELPLI